MASKYDHYQDHLEWEVIDPNQEITYLTFETGLYKLNRNCIVKFARDNQYDLVATITGIAKKEELEPNDEKIEGNFIKGETIIGYSKDGLFKYKFIGVVISAIKSNFIAVNSFEVEFQATLIFDNVEKSFAEIEAATTSIQEWYLSGKSDINFPRSTSRSVDKSFKRIREGIDNEDEFRLIKSSGSGRDYLMVKFADTSFLVARVAY